MGEFWLVSVFNFFYVYRVQFSFFKAPFLTFTPKKKKKTVRVELDTVSVE